MRIVAGTARGRTIVAPDGDTTRPTTDRVREAVFNALFSRVDLDGAVVADLFAGSGAMGLEALSRGAEHVTFVDSDRHAVRAIETNVATLGFADAATIRSDDVAAFLARPSADAFDLVILDPPYAHDDWDALLSTLVAHVDPSAVVVAESDREIVPARGWKTLRVGSYGGTVVTFVALGGDADADADPTGATA